jgi:hypothetical protein
MLVTAECGPEDRAVAMAALARHARGDDSAVPRRRRWWQRKG